MSRFFKVWLCLFSLLLLLTNCRKETLDEYYSRPDWLAQPIYQQLQSGKFGKDTVYSFKSFLACIDKAGYKSTLSAAGYYTIFAPTDSAFNLYLKNHNFSSVSAIDSATAKKIVAYSLVYNAYKKSQLADYQSVKAGWVESQAFKRRSVYYKGFYTDTAAWKRYGYFKVIDCNRLLSKSITSTAYSVDDNGNKYLPYFIQDYLSKQSLQSSDYTTFYPRSDGYSGFNVAEGKVLKADVAAENGYIHVIDRVVSSLPNFEEYMNSKPSNYSIFKGTLDSMAVYDNSSQATVKYLQSTGKSDKVYVKRYPVDLNFAPNDENYMDESNDAQKDGWTLYVPNNDAMNSFITNKLLKPKGHYATLKDVPSDIWINFFNVHAATSTVWPSRISSVSNSLSETMSDMVVGSTIIDPQFMSNGIFYGTNKVHESGIFYSVYGESYLDPNYSMMTNLIALANIRDNLADKNSTFSVLMIPNAVFAQAGYIYKAATFYNNWSASGTEVNDTLKRILKMHIYHGTLPDNFNSGSGLLKTIGGGYVKYKMGKVYAVGNIDTTGALKSPVNATLLTDRNPDNGKVYATDNLLTPAKGKFTITQYLRNNPNYTKFYNLLKVSSVNIESLTANDENMILVPDAAAMASAPSTSDDQTLIDRFIKYHIVPKYSFIPDGSGGGGTYSTKLQTGEDPNKVIITNSVPGVLQIQDEYGNVATVYNDATKSMTLAKNTIIHLINKVLKYKM